MSKVFKLIFFGVALLFFISATNTVYSKAFAAPSKQYIDTLRIIGDNIWVRSEPKTGEVIMKLNNGTVCLVLQKGEEQTIRGNTDYWYKIEYKGKEGWVFGSQTSLKQTSNEDFESFFNRFVSDLMRAEGEEVDLAQYISPLHGLDYTYLDCNSDGPSGFIDDIQEKNNHYTSKSDMAEVWTPIYFDYEIWKLSGMKGKELKNRVEITETTAILEIPGDLNARLMRGIRITFRLIEGKWYMLNVNENRCVKGNFTEAKHISFKDFIDAFVRTYFTVDHNLDKMIALRSVETNAFIHPEIGFTHFYNPGVMCVPYGISDYYGDPLNLEGNFNIYPEQSPEEGFCTESRSPDGIYFQYIENLPTYMDGGSAEWIEWPYPEKYKNSKKVRVNILKDAWIVKTMYFLEADGRWWLVIIDQCDCSA